MFCILRHENYYSAYMVHYSTCVSTFFVNGDKVITLEPTCIYSECVYDNGVDNEFFIDDVDKGIWSSTIGQCNIQ